MSIKLIFGKEFIDQISSCVEAKVGCHNFYQKIKEPKLVKFIQLKWSDS